MKATNPRKNRELRLGMTYFDSIGDFARGRARKGRNNAISHNFRAPLIRPDGKINLSTVWPVLLSKLGLVAVAYQ